MNKTILFSALIVLVAAVFSFKNVDINSEKITGEYLALYLRSQDIDFDVKPRAHISDSHIYSASGFLYAMGHSPTAYNFQHPPLIKYFFGLSTILLGSALWTQVFFAISLPLLTFCLGLKAFKSYVVSFVGALLLIADPLYQNLTRHTLLDLGQATFALAYTLAALYFSNFPLAAGIFLGLFAASKFWSSAIIFFIAIEAFIFWKKRKLNIKRILITLVSAFIVFNLIYSVSYIKVDNFNIVFWQAKMAKFMLHHDVATQPGANLILFLTGSFHAWWNQEVSRDLWSILWPVAFATSIVNLMKSKKTSYQAFLFAFPVFYLLTLSTQAPFSRYFILCLPFFYLSFAYFLRKAFSYLSSKVTH